MAYQTAFSALDFIDPERLRRLLAGEEPASAPATEDVAIPKRTPLSPVGQEAPPAAEPFPWSFEVPGKEGEEPTRSVALEGLATITRAPAGRTLPSGFSTRIQAPEGMAEFTPSTPAQQAAWLAQQREAKATEEAALNRRATLRAQQEVQQAQMAEARRAEQQQRMSMALEEIYRRGGPTEYIKALSEVAKMSQQGQTTAGTPEAQAFREILRTKDLPSALEWLEKFEATKQGRGTRALTAGEVGARTTAQQNAMIEAARKRAYETARGKAEGGIEMAPDMPLTPAEATRAGVPMGTTRGELAGQALSTPTQRKDIADSEQTFAILDQMDQLTNKVITASSTGEAYAQGTGLQLRKLRRDPDAVAFLSTREAMLGPLARQISAEVGVLTDRDIARIGQAIPSPWDTADSAKAKMSVLRNLASARREARLGAIEAIGIRPKTTTTQPEASQPAPPGGRPGRYRMDDGSIQIWDGQTWQRQ